MGCKNSMLLGIGLLLLSFVADMLLANYGNSLIFRVPKFPSELSIEDDKYEGVTIEEHNTLQVLGKGSIIDSDTIVRILKYSIIGDQIYFESETVEGEIVYLQLDYTEIHNEPFRYNLQSVKDFLKGSEMSWVDVSEQNSWKLFLIQTRLLCFLSCIIVMAITFLRFLVHIGS